MVLRGILTDSKREKYHNQAHFLVCGSYTYKLTVKINYIVSFYILNFKCDQNKHYIIQI